MQVSFFHVAILTARSKFSSLKDRLHNHTSKYLKKSGIKVLIVIIIIISSFLKLELEVVALKKSSWNHI